ncbi:pilus assembly protein PilZ [Shewanella schlegeliana]|uniref:Pilus assembly protein PilZ n=1 Tax=Shewanella schlegeliana TaxID=190308 RepID=A0ABS1SYX3_9GAMM|nr:PilZ domain-containing protein [Shewanella schlegeliana]MBL4913739.1 pilus assembly protein PilZ [Shewanella schlegeliana]MCL1111544.1 pilus assembly protein PilZ [Shewanella schlegeliana]GIU36700.1 pilus assembly protein PilZ [Shewanella schlegeliana]
MTNLVVKFDSLQQLYRAYMPFIKPVGIFVSCSESFTLGQEIQVSYQLPGGSVAHNFTGSVIWINPLGASGGRPAGIGVKILSDSGFHKHQIEQLLSQQLASGDLTCTM